MKLKTGIPILAVLLVAVWVAFQRAHPNGTITTGAVKASAAPPGARARQALNYTPPPSAKDKRTKECRATLNRLLAIDLSTFGYHDTRQRPDLAHLMEFQRALRDWKLTNGCAEITETDPLFATDHEFFRACGEIPEVTAVDKHTQVRAAACLDKLYVLRLQALADRYASVPAGAIDDPQLVGMLMLGTPSSDPTLWSGRYLELARRRAELAPSDPGSAVGLTQALYMKLMTNRQGQSESAPDAATLSELQASAENVERLHPGDVRALETRLLIARAKGNIEEMKSIANQSLQRGENTDDALFYLAQSYYLSGDKTRARTEIEKLQKADPRNMRWREALEAMERAPASTPLEAIFPDRNTSFTFDDRDPFVASDDQPMAP